MNIQEEIKADMVDAMKEKNQEVLSLLRVVSGEFSRIGKELTDEQSIKVLRKMSDNAKEQGNQKEVDILKKYLPQMFDENRIKLIVAKIIHENDYSGMKDMGKVMGELKNHSLAPQIDGKISSKITKELLS